MNQPHSTTPAPKSDIQTRRRYLAALATFAAYACGADAHEVTAACRIIARDVPKTLAKLERAG